MKISVITPTCDRPFGMRMCEKYIDRQTQQPHEWIVADSGQAPAVPVRGSIHLHQPMPPGAQNLAANVMRSLDRVTGDVVIVMEDDDWYARDHIAECVRGLSKFPVHGCKRLNYFNVRERCYIEMGNIGAALCQTAFRIDMLPAMRAAAQMAHASNDFGIDGRFWRERQHLSQGRQTVIGIKGLPGTPGLGIGHRPKKATRRWVSDPHMLKLVRWIGQEDAEVYAPCSSANTIGN